MRPAGDQVPTIRARVRPWVVALGPLFALVVILQAGVTGAQSPGSSPVASLAPSSAASPGPSPVGLATTSCAPDGDDRPAPSGAPPVGATSVTDSQGTQLDLLSVPVGVDPTGVAIDTTDAYGRVFSAIRGERLLDVRYGRSADLQGACRLPMPGSPSDVAIDPGTGTVLVALADAPRVILVDGRADPTRISGWVDLPGEPGQVVIDPEARQAWVSLPRLGQVALLEPDPSGSAGAWHLRGTFAAGSYPVFLAVDPARQRLLVSAQGQPLDAQGDEGHGAILAFDTGTWPPSPLGAPIPAGVPTGALFDPASGTAYVLENGPDTLAWIADLGATTPTVERVALPWGTPAKALNPVDLAFLPGDRDIAITMSTTEGGSSIGGHLDVFALDDAGRPTYARSIPASLRTRGIGVDPTTGRVFVSDATNGRLTAYVADVPSVPPPPAPQIAESLPSPLRISLAPEDVVRTVGLSLFVLLLVGAPTPLFNETLESHLEVIHGFVGRRVKGGRQGFGRVADAARRFAGSVWGVGVYLLGAAVLYAFLTPGFPGTDWPLVLGLSVFSLAVATVVDILPGERFVRRRYGARGRFRVALWTLVLAAATVLISRIANLSPGYMYGIIGTFLFAIPLTSEDEGRMEARGAAALLILALVAWFARIPFEPTPGVPLTGPLLVINMALVGMFVVAVEGLVFGLIPISFMPGQKILAWSKWRWALLWGAGLALFAHVLVYPVTLAQPSPDPSTLVTTLVSAGLYGALAVGFWLVFRWHDGRVGSGGAGSGPEAS